MTSTEDEMVGWHHRLHGHEFEQAPGDGEGQGSLACCSSWGCKKSDVTWLLNSNNSLFSQHLVNTSAVAVTPFLHVCMCSVLSDSLQPHRLSPTRLFCPWDSPGKNVGVGCHFLLQGIFLTQGLNPHLNYLLTL